MGAELASERGDLVETEQRCKSEGEANQEKMAEMVANSAREKAALVENARSEKEGVTREKDIEIGNVRQVVAEREAELENVRKQVSDATSEITKLNKEKEEMLANFNKE